MKEEGDDVIPVKQEPDVVDCQSADQDMLPADVKVEASQYKDESADPEFVQLQDIFGTEDSEVGKPRRRRGATKQPPLLKKKKKESRVLEPGVPTIDYYNEELGGPLRNKDDPSEAELAAAILAQCAGRQTTKRKKHEEKKFQFISFILHLSGKVDNFPELYKYYHYLETMVNTKKQIRHWGDLDLPRIQTIILDSIQNRICLFDLDKLGGRGGRGHHQDDEEEDPDWILSSDDSGDELHGGKPNGMPCDVCDFVGYSMRGLEKHKFFQHNHGKLCALCGYVSNSFKDYLHHMGIHPIDCDQCGDNFMGLLGLWRHVNKSHVSEDQLFLECHICFKRILTSKLDAHLDDHEKKKSNYFPCEQCEESFNSKEDLKTHNVNVHTERRSKRGQCPVCNKYVSHVKKHIRRTSCRGNARKSCDQCDKSFSTPTCLRNHIRYVHEKRKDKYCDQCNYSTYSSFNLRIHISKMHTMIPLDVVCEICHMNTKSLDYHMKTNHLDVLIEMQSRDAQSEIQTEAQEVQPEAPN